MACIIISTERMPGITATSVSAVPAMDFTGATAAPFMDFSSSYVCPIAPEDRPFFAACLGSFETEDNNYIMLQ